MWVLNKDQQQALFSVTVGEHPGLQSTLCSLDLIRTLREDGSFHQEDFFSMTKLTEGGVIRKKSIKFVSKMCKIRQYKVTGLFFDNQKKAA